MIDVESLLAPVSDESPCGEDLEYDPAFVAMEQASKGRPAQQMGDSVVEAQDPDWRAVEDRATELLSRTKDLRVGVYLARALVNTAGVAGLGAGMALLRGLVERYWDGLHPRLDPEDNNDPTMRMNILSALCDSDAMLASIRTTPLVEARGIGRFSMHQIEMASGQTPAPEGVEVPGLTVIDGAFLDCDLDELQATADAVERSLEHVTALDAALTGLVGASQAQDFDPLSAMLAGIRGVLAERLARRGVAVEGADVPAAAGGAQPLTGDVNSREDVVRLLDRACEYFERHEPSSPVPLLLRRAKRLVSKDFLEIMRDLAPDGLTQAETIGGVSGQAGEE